VTSFLVASFVGLVLGAQDGADAEPWQRITPQHVAFLRSQMRFLADDLNEGRAPGTRGGLQAARYLSAQLEGLGIAPFGDAGSYLQRVPLIGVTTDNVKSSLTIDVSGASHPIPLLDDCVVGDETQTERVELDAPLVFVGYGIASPEMTWDDYKDVDVNGKVLLMLVNDPPSDDPAFFGGKGLTYSGRWTYKYEEAARRGAIGAILIHRDVMATYGWQVVRNSWARERPYVDARTKDEPRLKLVSWIRDAAIAPLLKDAGFDLDELIARAATREFSPVALPMRAQAKVESTMRSIDTYNVVGVLRGDDRADEYVVYTAHYDHLGNNGATEKDGIYNGAVDNASGCATLLQVIKRFTEERGATKSALPRSLVFLFPTAEESGLRGSEYFAHNPPVPAKQLVANINIDGVAVDGVPAEFALLGVERSTLREPAEAAAQMMGVKLVPDASPELGLMYRSDHFSLAKVGIPAISMKNGTKFFDRPDDFALSAQQDYTKNRYHQPSDEYDAKWDLKGAYFTAEFAYRIGQFVALDPTVPEYRDGDEFDLER
jgi:Zn-dependent M28 family amino/carboxypeptidase